MSDTIVIRGSEQGFLTLGTGLLVHWQWVHINSHYYWTFSESNGNPMGKYDHSDEVLPPPERVYFAYSMLSWILSLAEPE
jgi:hypothetical protein